MADPVQTAAPTVDIPTAPGTPAQVRIPGSDYVVPTGSGVERLIPVPAPFRTQAPPWYTPPGTVWSELGCAVPQVGLQANTNNAVIFDFCCFVQRALFDVMWKFPDRTLECWPERDCLWEIHQLLTQGRNRLISKTTPDNDSPLEPSKLTPAPEMFLVWPVPVYSQLGCKNTYLRRLAIMVLNMVSEAMQHGDNAKSYHVSTKFFNVIYPYIQFLLVDFATKFFGVDVKTAKDKAFVVPDAAWLAYDSNANSVSFEGTSTLPPLNYGVPSPIDLQRISALTIEQAIPFLQPWPDAKYMMSSAGIWAGAASPASDSSAAGVATGNQAAGASPSIFTTGGPPTK